MTALLASSTSLGLAALAGTGQLTPLALIQNASGPVLAVMGILVLMSLISWYIIGYKFFFLRAAADESERFVDAFWRSKDIEAIYKQAQGLSKSPLSSMFVAGYSELARLQQGTQSAGDREGDLENVSRALSKAQTKETTRLESMVPFLATCGSAAPFIGLFGTVWGIMTSFLAIAETKKASIDILAPHIAEALIATAVGLVAAIPAVMAYNFFTRRITVITSEMDTFSKDFLNIVRRHFLK
jgi:biopolymer transport protein TolQ